MRKTIASGKKYIANIDVLRFVLAIWVLLFHINISWPQKIPGFINNIIMQGAVGMTVFFMLSGFCLVLSDNKNSLKQFYLSRITKIYPLYLFVSVLSVFFYKLGDNFIQNGFIFLTSALMIQSWFPFLFPYFHNGLTWFISDLVFLYLLYPFLFKTISQIFNIKKKNTFLTTILFLYLSASLPSLIYYFFGMQYREVYVFPVYRIPEFAIGILLGLIYKNNQWSKLRFALLPSGLFMGAYLAIFGPALPGYITHNFFVVPTAAVLILSLAYIKFDIFNAKISKLLGSITFPLYLFQSLIITCFKLYQETLVIIFPVLKHNYLILLFLLLLTVLLSIVSKPVFVSRRISPSS